MPRNVPLPRSEHLSAAPQLASLAVLETAANVAVLALAAHHPQLARVGPYEVDFGDPNELRAAAHLLRLVQALDLSIDSYRRALSEHRLREREEDDLF